MARITIIPGDRFVRVDDEAVTWPEAVDLGDANIRAVQWYGQFGSVEYAQGPAARIETLPAAVTAIADAFDDTYAAASDKQNGVADPPSRAALVAQEEAEIAARSGQ